MDVLDSLGNFIQLLPADELYSEILIVLSMTESIVQPGPFPKDVCMLDIIVV